MLFAAVHESHVGSSRHFAVLHNVVAIGGIADLDEAAPINLEL
jgi:hypothetical protein